MKKALGFWRCWALVVGSMIGSGIFMLPALLAPYGYISLWGWLIASTGALLIALSFASLARRSPALGGPYGYTQQTFGPLPGFMVGWGLWISFWVSIASQALSFVGYLSFFLTSLQRSAVMAVVCAVLLVWCLTAINLRGARAAGITQMVTTILKILPVMLIVVGGLMFGELQVESAPVVMEESLLVQVSKLAMLTMWAYVGIEAVTIPSSEIINPKKTIPRALIIGLLSVTVLYVLSTLAVWAVVPPSQLMNSHTPFADVAEVLIGPAGAGIVTVGILISIVGVMNGSMLACGTLPKAMADDSNFPRRFTQLNRRRAPQFSLIITSVLISAILALNMNKSLVAAYEVLILLATLTALLPYAASALADLIQLLKMRKPGNQGLLPGCIRAAAALIFALAMIIGSGWEVLVYGVVLLTGGLPVYLYSRNKARAAGLVNAEPTGANAVE